MEKRQFFITLLAAFVFLAIAASFETATFRATGTVSLELPLLATGMTLSFNGVEGNNSFTAGSNVLVAAQVNVSGAIIFLDTNISGWQTLNGTTPFNTTVYFGNEGVYNVTAWFPGDENHSASSVTYFITVTPAPQPPGPPGGGGGGGGAAIGPAANVTKEKIFTVTVVTNDSVSIYGKNLDPGNYFGDTRGATDFPITGVGMAPRQDVSEFRIIIETVPKPAGIPGIEEQYGLETPYKYLRVTVIGIDPELAFRSISINFRVEKAWITLNSIDEGTITLYRYDNGWKPLSVIRTGGDDYYSVFNAGDVRAFSRYFVISAKGLLRLPRLFAPAYIISTMTYLQLAILLFAILILLIAVAGKKRKRGELAIEY